MAKELMKSKFEETLEECDFYSSAFFILCQQLGIPVMQSEFHVSRNVTR